MLIQQGFQLNESHHLSSPVETALLLANAKLRAILINSYQSVSSPQPHLISIEKFSEWVVKFRGAALVIIGRSQTDISEDRRITSG
jgi:hypothetical protein